MQIFKNIDRKKNQAFFNWKFAAFFLCHPVHTYGYSHSVLLASWNQLLTWSPSLDWTLAAPSDPDPPVPVSGSHTTDTGPLPSCVTLTIRYLPFYPTLSFESLCAANSDCLGRPSSLLHRGSLYCFVPHRSLSYYAMRQALIGERQPRIQPDFHINQCDSPQGVVQWFWLFYR